MKCEFFGCPNTEDVQEVTIAPGTNVKLCPTCTASEFSMCDQPEDGPDHPGSPKGPSSPKPSRGCICGDLDSKYCMCKNDTEYFDNHAV